MNKQLSNSTIESYRYKGEMNDENCKGLLHVLTTSIHTDIPKVGTVMQVQPSNDRARASG